MSRCVACILLKCHFLRYVTPSPNKSHNNRVSLSTDPTRDSWSDWEQYLPVLAQATSFVTTDTRIVQTVSAVRSKNKCVSCLYGEFRSIRKQRILKTLNFVAFKYGRDSSAHISLFSTRWLWTIWISIELFPETSARGHSPPIKWGGSRVCTLYRGFFF